MQPDTGNFVVWICLSYQFWWWTDHKDTYLDHCHNNKSLDIYLGICGNLDTVPLIAYQNSFHFLSFSTNTSKKGLLRYVTFGDKTFSSCLIPWGYYTAGSKKVQALVYMWSTKLTLSFSNVGALLLKIWTFTGRHFHFLGSDFVAI